MAQTSTGIAPLLASIDVRAEELRDLTSQQPTSCGWLMFADASIERGYQLWHRHVHGRNVRTGLLICNFLYYLISIGFATWSHEYTNVSSTPALPVYGFSTEEQMLSLTDMLTGVSLTMCFVGSFSEFAVRHPQPFSMAVLLFTISFVALRAYILTRHSAAAFSSIAPVVAMLLMVCFVVGATLLRMPFFATLTVGLLTLVIYSALALTQLSRPPQGSGWYPVGIGALVFATALGSHQLEAMQRKHFLLHAASACTESGGAATLTRSSASSTRATHDDVGRSAATWGGATAAVATSGGSSDGNNGNGGVGGAGADVSGGGALASGTDTPCDPGVDESPLPEMRLRNHAAVRNMELLGPLLSVEQLAATSERTVDGAALSRLMSSSVLSAASMEAAVVEAGERANDRRGVDAVRAMLRQTMSNFAGGLLADDPTESNTSVAAVQRALSETGVASLRELIAHETRDMLERLPLLPWVTPTTAVAVPPVPPRPPPQTKVTFELVEREKLPSWYTPYPFVQTGYRVHFSYRLAFLSLFRLHNETVNVYTELLPCVGFGVWTVFFLTEHHRDAPLADRYIVGAGLIIATVVRPLCSGLAHLLHCTSARGYILWWSVDYLSICLAILASSVVSGHFAFYCEAPLQVLFFTSAAGLLSTTIVAVMAVASPALRSTSFLLFVLFCNGVPFVYQISLKWFGADGPNRLNDVDPNYILLWAASLGTFFLGIVVKSVELPERVARAPWSDLLLPSHSFWHAILNAGFVLGTFLAWDVYLQWRGRPENQCPAPAPRPAGEMLGHDGAAF